jgi:S1/P1 nuclease
MKSTIRFIAATLFLTCVFATPSFAWSDTGHMAVAFVAYRNLNPVVRNRVDFLITLNPRFNIWRTMIPRNTPAGTRRAMLFMIAATWPDQIKGDGEHVSDGPDGGNTPPSDGTADNNIGYTDRAMHKYWHFIDLPFSTDGTPTVNPVAPNALTQIAVFRSVLASTSPDALKSYDLVWLMHVVGDVHQPLHCAARFNQGTPRGDEGGNLVEVCSPQCGRLHAFWDGILGTSNNPNVAMQVALRLAPAHPRLAANLNVSDWILDGLRVARLDVYRPPVGPGAGPFNLTPQYRNAARQIAQQRVALAGARLARILNTELR